MEGSHQTVSKCRAQDLNEPGDKNEMPERPFQNRVSRSCPASLIAVSTGGAARCCKTMAKHALSVWCTNRTPAFMVGASVRCAAAVSPPPFATARMDSGQECRTRVPSSAATNVFERPISVICQGTWCSAASTSLTRLTKILKLRTSVSRRDSDMKLRLVDV